MAYWKLLDVDLSFLGNHVMQPQTLTITARSLALGIQTSWNKATWGMRAKVFACLWNPPLSSMHATLCGLPVPLCCMENTTGGMESLCSSRANAWCCKEPPCKLNLLLLKSAYVRISLLSPHKYTFSINFLEVFTVLYYFVVVIAGKFKWTAPNHFHYFWLFLYL